MGKLIRKQEAQKILRQAFNDAMEDTQTPSEWGDLARYLREDTAPRTYTPALGTALLARAHSDNVDSLSIKESYSDNSFSLRSLCHNTLVPLSVELGFDIYASGREPINNQPFFRYDHYSQIERISDTARPYFDRLKESVAKLNFYTKEEAYWALVAFLRVCGEAANKRVQTIAGSRLAEHGLIKQTSTYVTSGFDIPAKLQACVAAALDIANKEVISRRLNDPSRDLPGDVQIGIYGSITTAIEVRGKAVTATELEQFVRKASEFGISRLGLVVHAGKHQALPTSVIIPSLEEKYDVLISVHESMPSFLRNAFSWSGCSVSQTLATFPDAMYKRLQEIQVRGSELEKWVEYFPPTEVE